MDAATPAQSILVEGQAMAVDPQQIAASLRQLWAVRKRGDRTVMRACMANLVIYAGVEAQAALASEVVAQLAAASHLVRAIVLIADEAAETPGMRASLSAHCQMPKAGGQRVCCEQITLEAAGEAAERLPSAVLPLLVPDLPVFIWWMGDPPFGAPIFDQLIDAADRLIVDTTIFQDPTFSLTRLASLVRLNAGRLAVSDLNWARLSGWQDQLAQAFDSVETVPYLERLERLTVRYVRPQGGGRVDPEKALLLTEGWLLNRLGWKLPPALARVGVGHFRGKLRRAGRELTIEITPHELTLPAGWEESSGVLLSIELRASLNGREATFRFERQATDLDTIATIITFGEGEPLRSTRMRPRLGLAALMADDLALLDHDYLFEAALETAAHLSGAAQLLRS